MYAEFMDVTPSLAQEWLNTSNGNPRWTNGKLVNKEAVRRIKHDIEAGNWHTAGDPIQFREDGTLFNGHHRLTAVVESGITVNMLVVFDVPVEAEIHVDDNQRRSLPQRLSMQSGVVGMALIGLAVQTNNGYTTSRYSDMQRINWLEEHPLATQAYRIAGRGVQGKRILQTSAGACGLLYALEYGVSDEKLDMFARIVNSGYAEGLGASAAITLRNAVLRKAYVGPKLQTVQFCMDVQSAIRDYVAGVSRKSIYKANNNYYLDQLRKVDPEKYT